MKFNFCTQVFQTGESIPIRTLSYLHITSFSIKYYLSSADIYDFYFYATFPLFFGNLYLFFLICIFFNEKYILVQKKSLFMLENKSKEMYLFSQNASRILFYFIKYKIKVVENVASRRTAIFNMNIWALHRIDSLIPISKIRIFTNYFTNLNIFCEKQTKNRNCSQVLKKLWKFRTRDLETREIIWWAFQLLSQK